MPCYHQYHLFGDSLGIYPQSFAGTRRRHFFDVHEARIAAWLALVRPMGRASADPLSVPDLQCRCRVPGHLFSQGFISIGRVKISVNMLSSCLRLLE